MIPDSIEKEAIERCRQFLQVFLTHKKPIARTAVHDTVGLYQVPGFTAKTLARLLWVEYLKASGDAIQLTPQGQEFLRLSPTEQNRKMRQDWRKFLKTKTCDKCGKKRKHSLVVFRGQLLCEDCLNPAAEKPDYSFYREYSVFDTVNPY